ncbi:MAG TPA: zinc finger MYND domain-containing protein [Planctomycetes bacterium]|nr:zinc finger MYND domain-containing protein [Planctomycetota bacterium]
MATLRCCSGVAYCSRACQKKGWSQHRARCARRKRAQLQENIARIQKMTQGKFARLRILANSRLQGVSVTTCRPARARAVASSA